MNSHNRFFPGPGFLRPRAAVFAVAVALVFAAAAPALAERVRNHFDSDSIMRPPGFFEYVVLGAPGPAKWLVLSDRNPPSAPAVAVQVESGRPATSIAAAVRRTYAFRDGTASTFVKSGGSRSGLVVRYVDEKNYVALLVDGQSGEAELTSVRDGKSESLGRGTARFAQPWSRLELVISGPSLKATFGDAPLLEGTDPHPAAGRVGMAVSGPGEARFDELILDSGEIHGP
jgi:hypothetical protein